MRKFLIALALFLAPTLAFAQCSGNFPAGYACGSISGGLPGPIPFASVLSNPPLVITPPNPSNVAGLVISQTTPNTGSVAGPILLNSITVVDQGQTVTGTG